MFDPMLGLLIFDFDKKELCDTSKTHIIQEKISSLEKYGNIKIKETRHQSVTAMFLRNGAPRCPVTDLAYSLS